MKEKRLDGRVQEAKRPVRFPALRARIDRALARQGQFMATARGLQARVNVGDYYLIDTDRNCVVAHDVDPEALARNLGVMQPREVLAE